MSPDPTITDLDYASQIAEADAIDLSNQYEAERAAVKAHYDPLIFGACVRAQKAQKALCDARALAALVERKGAAFREGRDDAESIARDVDAIAVNLGLTAQA